MTNELITFPGNEKVPEKYKIISPVEQHQYLCNGTIREWSGQQHDVLSPLCEKIADTFRPKRIGSYPLLTETEALEALEAACIAYDHGRGAWPTMPVDLTTPLTKPSQP